MDGGVAPPALGQEPAAGIPNARLVVLPGVGQFPHREAPDHFAAVVEDFLTGR